MWILARVAFVSLIFVTFSAPLSGQEFHLQNLTRPLGLPFGYAPWGLSLNNHDVIATLLSGPTNVPFIDNVVTIAANGNFTNVTRGLFNRPGQASINNLGQIVFTNNPDDNHGLGDCVNVNCDVIFWNGSSFQNITNGSIPVEPAGVLGEALNDSGDVAIGTKQGLALYNGVSLTMLTEGTSITGTGNLPPSINSSGQIAFVGIDLTIDRNDNYLFDGSAISNLTNNPALPANGGGIASINDTGHVAFGAPVVGAGSHLFFYDGTKTIDLTATLGLPDRVTTGPASLNSSNQIAFVTSDVFGRGPSELWFLDLNTRTLKRVDSTTVGSGGGEFLVSTQINDRGNIAYVKSGEVIFARLVQNLNSLVNVVPRPSTFKTSNNTAGCPTGFVGKFSFYATLTNTKSATLSDLSFRVRTLTNENLLQNADDVPGGVGATVTVARTGDFSDGLFRPGEFVDQPFSICLKNKNQFSFFVDVLGTRADKASASVARR